jgi:deoxyribodipyrimidine photo-lyase
VAGSNSGKKYFANQENISKFTRTPFHDSFLNEDYSVLESMEIPTALKGTQIFAGKTLLPENPEILEVDPDLPWFIYNYYNLDPLWHPEENGNRILLLEPKIFETYPIGQNCVDFMLALARQIPGIQIFVGSFEDLVSSHKADKLYFKEHPLNNHYRGTEEPRDWICDAVTGYYPSFFAYWKVLERQLKKQL